MIPAFTAGLLVTPAYSCLRLLMILVYRDCSGYYVPVLLFSYLCRQLTRMAKATARNAFRTQPLPPVHDTNTAVIQTADVLQHIVDGRSSNSRKSQNNSPQIFTYSCSD